ncbi:MAG TPA: hypothetical protein VN034_12170 [Sphingopyxis sp.]|nr:hypothetical protein [Sphingopyxis sp.]
MHAKKEPPRDESADERWARFTPIRTGEDYVESLRSRGVAVHMFGERIAEPVDHPVIRPSTTGFSAMRRLGRCCANIFRAGRAWRPNAASVSSD